jgi:hypothetical protein
MARDGTVPLAKRSAGGHWEIPDSPQLRKWAKANAKLRASQQQARNTRSKGITLTLAKASRELSAARARLADHGDGFEMRAMQQVAQDFTSRIQADWGLEVTTPAARRKGAWKAVEDGAAAIRRWHKEHWQDASDGERNHFRSLMREVEGVADAVLGD